MKFLKKNQIKTICWLLLSLVSLNVAAQQGRIVKDLSINNWKLWLDTAAHWKNDILYTPPVTIQQLPFNKPTGGWSALQKATGKTVHLPALDLLSCLKDVKMEKKTEGDGENAAMTTFNTSQKNAANVVGQQLLLNMLKYSGEWSKVNSEFVKRETTNVNK